MPNTRGFGRSSRKTKAAAAAAASNGTGNNEVMGNVRANQSQSSLRSSGGGSSTTAANGSTPAQKPLFMCQPFVRTALVRGDFTTIVQLPKYVDRGEWLALNVFEFFTHLNQFYGVLSEVESCPTMNAGPGVDYLWIDANKKTVSLPAATYIDYVLTWISQKFDDQTIFPTKQGVPFPPHFQGVLKNIVRQMFRVFAHIYHNHFDKLVHLSLEAHWNSFFAHFISFTRAFELLDRADTGPLLPLMNMMDQQQKLIVNPVAP